MNENRYQCAVWGEDSNTYYIALEIKAVQTGHRINMRSKKQCRELRQTHAYLETIQNTM